MAQAQVHTSDREHPLITAYLIERSSIFVELRKQREKGSANPNADKYFQYKQKTSDEASPTVQKIFLKMMQGLAQEMDEKTQFLTDINTYKKNNPREPATKVLDLCMAPGGFSAKVRECLPPLTEIYGITLPVSNGGHELLVELGPRLHVEFLDITMLAAEMGVTSADIPFDHPDQNLFVFDRPFFGYMFNLILCDGKVLRTHKRQEYRENIESMRLNVAELIFTLQHIKSGGTFVILLHKAEAWLNLRQIYKFSKFSDSVQLFKPTKKHAIRSSFYLVAKGVKPQEEEALRALEEWKEIWVSTTLRCNTSWSQETPPDEEVNAMLEDFGETFVEMCEPLWEIQSRALQCELEKGFSTPTPLID